MLKDDMYKLIRLSKNMGLSQRHTAIIFGISRATVRKYWYGENIPDKSQRSYVQNRELALVNRPRKEYVCQLIQEYIDVTKESRTTKQSITRQEIYNHISNIIPISYQTMCRYYNEMDLKEEEVFIRLSFDPGEVMQVDWCEVSVDIDNVRHKCPLFCAVLGYSYQIYTQIFPNMKFDNFISGHVNAFRYFNGVSKHIFYDNLRVAADSGSGKDVTKNPRFSVVEAHYGFEARFMNAAKGNEKGLVENLCQIARKLSFSPIPKVMTMKEMQDINILNIDNYNKHHKLKGRKAPIIEMANEEKLSLLPLPLKEYNPFPEKQVVVDKFSTFTYDTCKYSVPTEFVHKTISLLFSPYEIYCYYNGNLIYTHTKSLFKNQKIYDPFHYLDILQKKPRAIEHAEPLKIGKLPDELDEFRAKCKGNDKNEQLVGIMQLCREINVDIVLNAVAEANKLPNPNYKIVENYIKIYTHFSNSFDEETILKHNDVDDIKVIDTSLDEYNTLIPSSDNNNFTDNYDDVKKDTGNHNNDIANPNNYLDNLNNDLDNHKNESDSHNNDLGNQNNDSDNQNNDSGNPDNDLGNPTNESDNTNNNTDN
jgi:transcriptional regulator with XRE-family HTH domain